MIKRVRNAALRLHRDEAGRETVETILLLAVAIVVLIAIVVFVKWAIEYFNEKAEDAKTELDGLQP